MTTDSESRTRKDMRDRELAGTLHYLDRLGSKDAIADYLRAAGIKGKRMRSCMCPVANWLAFQLDTAQRVSVGSKITLAAYEDGPPAEAQTPENVSQFIYAFDQDEYPLLDEEASQ